VSAVLRRLAVLAGLATLAVLGALPAGSAVAAPRCSGTGAMPTAGDATVTRKAALCLINRRRAAHGLHALRFAKPLDAAARAFASRMVDETFFAHVAPDGQVLTQRVRAAGYLRAAGRYLVGENLAWEPPVRASARSIVTAWMHSAVHRATMLDARFREIGIGIAAGTPGSGRGITVTADFGVRHL
jgi:uncharacterized protein YkwD